MLVMEYLQAKKPILTLIRQLKLHHHLWDFIPWSSRFVLLLFLFTPVRAGPVMHQAVNAVTSGSGVVDLQRFSRSHFAFSLDLYSALANQSSANSESEDGNLLFSPYSISTALSMIFLGAGAGSSTSLQLRSALHLNNFSFSDVHDSYKTVLSKLADPYYGEILVSVNNIFQQEGIFISEKYKRALEEFYNVQIQPMDFKRHPQLVVDNLNLWARNFTGQKMSHLRQQSLTPALIDPELGITLTNGLAFRSHWLFRFDPASTFDKGLFYTTSKKRLFKIAILLLNGTEVLFENFVKFCELVTTLLLLSSKPFFL